MKPAPVFYVGLHQPSDAFRFERACVSINRLGVRKKPLGCPDVLVDSGAFTELERHHRYRHPVSHYAAQLRRLKSHGTVEVTAAVAQDYMCEPAMLKRTGLTIEKHQRLTLERYDRLLGCDTAGIPILPVLQGFSPEDYVRHLYAYGLRLPFGAWVGVGSVCKRNGDPRQVVDVLAAIHRERRDLRLHCFGVKQTALLHAGVRDLLWSADSMAWSYSARKQGRNGNSWTEARRFSDRVQGTAALELEPWQMPLPLR